MITADDLFEASKRAGYSGSSAQFKNLLKKSVDKGLFPGPRRRDQSKPGRPGLWDDTDIYQWLDVLWLHADQDTQDSKRLRLWLLGHETGDVRPIMAEQLRGLRRLLAGHDISEALNLVSEEGEQVLRHIGHMLQTRTVTSVAYLWPQDSPWDNLTKVEVQMAMGGSVAIQNAPWDKTNQAGWSPRETADVYPREDLPANLRAVTQTNLVTFHLLKRLAPLQGLGRGYKLPIWTLTSLIDLVGAATLEELGANRGLIELSITKCLHLFSQVPAGHVANRPLDPEAILRPYGGDPRLLFASAELLPMTTFLIAQNVANMQQPQRNRESRKLRLMAYALDRFRKGPNTMQQKFNAAVPLVLMFDPTEPPLFENLSPVQRRVEAVRLGQQIEDGTLDPGLWPWVELWMFEQLKQLPPEDHAGRDEAIQGIEAVRHQVHLSTGRRLPTEEERQAGEEMFRKKREALFAQQELAERVAVEIRQERQEFEVEIRSGPFSEPLLRLKDIQRELYAKMPPTPDWRQELGKLAFTPDEG